MRPALYVGTIRHRRFAVRHREFRHRISMVYAPAAPERARAVTAAVRRDTGRAPSGEVAVLTLGRGFNPVSFYFCGQDAVVAEVTSTPWGETELYVLPTTGATVERVEVDKRLHVSPFLGMDQRYSWATTRPGDRVSVHIAAREGDRTVFDATLNLARRPATRVARLRHALLRARVLPLIYAHAVVLALRRVPVHPHPRTQEPHPS